MKLSPICRVTSKLGYEPVQREFFRHSGLSVTPEPQRLQPRLWIRRLVIWREPGAVIRDITLRPGLNIVWSPDSGSSESAPIGHGSGKTAFCRLLRYCLGEDTFASDDQRILISKAFPNGHVGAEVLLNGDLWIVVRSLGSRHHDVVVANGSFDSALREDAPATGIAPLREAITQAIVRDAAPLMPPQIGEGGAWLAALAWATRDQECRFGHYLDWRDPNTASGSPVRGRSVEDRITIVRALIRALSSNENVVRRNQEDQENRNRSLRSELERLDWQLGRTRRLLVTGLGFDPGLSSPSELDSVAFKSAAAQSLTKLLNLPDQSGTTDLDSARRERDKAQDELRRFETELSNTRILVEERKKSANYIRAELPEAWARLTKEKNPICPICAVPTDKALAEGCKISTAKCDLEALQNRIAERRADLESVQNSITKLEAEQPLINSRILAARRALEPLLRTVTLLERALSDRSLSLQAANRLIDDARRYEDFLQERAKAAASADDTTKALNDIRDTLTAHRDAVANIVGHLSSCFDAVLHEFVPTDIKGEVKLDGNGFALKIQMGGERSTAAIESLKVVAFDLSSLIMTIEGKTNLSGFMVHDSPREADLGQSIYNRLFALVAQLESLTPTPLFQYIVTTTTEPPEEFRRAPWLCLMIKGAPAAERLFGADL